MERDCKINTDNTDCYYYVSGRCNHKEVGMLYCSTKGAACTYKKGDIAAQQWKVKYWDMMRMVRERAAR